MATRIHYGPTEPTMPQIPYRPDAQAKRYANSEEQLKAEGGKRVNVRLRGKSVKALQKIMRKQKCDQTEAINWALQELA